MTKALRWRVFTLQAGLIVVFGALAGFTLWASSYVQSSVTTQLAAQDIIFPAANSPEITVLPAVDAAAMRQYAGQLLTTGPQAEVWANNFMKVHLSAMPTYDAAATLARANPTSTADQATWETVFMGTTDRSMLAQRVRLVDPRQLHRARRNRPADRRPRRRRHLRLRTGGLAAAVSGHGARDGPSFRSRVRRGGVGAGGRYRPDDQARQLTQVPPL